MSPRAACRLESLGFEQVYDYVAGKADWKGAGLPLDGDAPTVQLISDATRSDVPTCTRDEQLGAVRDRTFAQDWDECVVVDCGNVVVGRLRGRTWDNDAGASVEEVMESGPTTVRPDGLLQPLVSRMVERGTKLVVVATPQGELLGVMFKDEAERLLSGEAPQKIWQDCDGCPGHWSVVIESEPTGAG